MSLIAVWVDQNHANVYKFTTDGIKKESLKGNFPNHHSVGSNLEEQKLEGRMFHELVPHLSGAEKILLLGPSMAKVHLKKYLETESKSLGQKIVGCETTDHPSEAQLLSFASKFFNTEHLK